MKYTETDMRKIIEEDFQDWIKLKWINGTYKNSSSEIILIDNEGYKYFCKVSVIFNAKRRDIKLNRFMRGNIYTIENINNFLRINKINVKLLSNKANDAHDILTWVCPTHGEFEWCWNQMSNIMHCPKCGHEASINPRKYTYDEVLDIFKENGMILISKSYTSNNSRDLEFICGSHPEKGIQKTSLSRLLSSHGCKFCNMEIPFHSTLKTHEQFIKDVFFVHNNKYTVISIYERSDKKVSVFCHKCSSIFDIKASHLTDYHGCPNCNLSRGEWRIINHLNSQNIIFKQQVRFDNCRGISKTLPFDFGIYIDENLYCLIEFDGRQHYNGWHNKEFSKIQIQATDNIKNKFCIDQNIKLVRIPYFDFKNIEHIIDSELSGLFLCK